MASMSLARSCGRSGGLGLLPLLHVAADLLDESPLVDDLHVHGVVLQEGRRGDYGRVGLHLDEGLRQGVEPHVSLLDGHLPPLAVLVVVDAGECGVDPAVAVGLDCLEDVQEVVDVQEGPAGAGVVVREVDHGDHRSVQGIAEVEDLVQAPEDVLLAGDLDPEAGLDVVVLPPVDDEREVVDDVVIDLLLGHAAVVDPGAGDDDVAAHCVEDDPGVPDAVEAQLGHVVVGPEVHVVGGVDGEVHVQALGHSADGEQLAEGVGDAGRHVEQVVVLLDGLIRVADELVVPEDLDHEVLRDVLQGEADLLVLRGAGVRRGPDHLHLERVEAEVVDVFYSILERASFARERDACRTEPYHKGAVRSHPISTRAREKTQPVTIMHRK